MLMTGADYRESLRRYRPRVFVDGQARRERGRRAAARARHQRGRRDLRLRPATRARGADDARARRHRGKTVNRMLHINETTDGPAQQARGGAAGVPARSGCAQRYLAHDALNAPLPGDAAHRRRPRHATISQRFLAYLHDVQDEDLTLGIAMTDAKGDRSQAAARAGEPRRLRPHRRAHGQTASSSRGTKAIVTGAPYMHEFLVMPCRDDDAGGRGLRRLLRRAGRCADGVTIVARPAGRPGESGREVLGQIRPVDRRRDLRRRVRAVGARVPRRRVRGGAASSPTSYATHHRHSCIGARAGFGDLLIGAGALMIEANGLDPERHGHIREPMVELITIIEGFFACGVAASRLRPATTRPASIMPEPVFANIGKLLLATQIYDMHRLAHYVSGGLIVALPGPDEDHNPETARLARRRAARGRPDIPAEQAHRGGALHRGPDRLAPGRLVFGDLACTAAARRRR